MRKSWGQRDRLNLESQVQKENRCKQSISQRGSSGCVDCTEIMYSAVQNGKSARGEDGGGRDREDEGTLRLSSSRRPPPLVSLSRRRGNNGVQRRLTNRIS